MNVLGLNTSQVTNFKSRARLEEFAGDTVNPNNIDGFKPSESGTSFYSAKDVKSGNSDLNPLGNCLYGGATDVQSGNTDNPLGNCLYGGATDVQSGNSDLNPIGNCLFGGATDVESGWKLSSY